VEGGTVKASHEYPDPGEGDKQDTWRSQLDPPAHCTSRLLQAMPPFPPWQTNRVLLFDVRFIPLPG
jgi:hypothetical protein